MVHDFRRKSKDLLFNAGNGTDASFAIWWMGPPVLGILLLALSVAFLAFPRQMAAPAQVENMTLSVSRRSSSYSMHSREDAQAPALNVNVRNEALMMTSYRSRSTSNVSRISLAKGW